ncbi:MAG: hypothetical protein K6E47_14280 [Lachnospiraceae bacterium]|nr:hypothetical protein [Lachnospiraceae bacterium]
MIIIRGFMFSIFLSQKDNFSIYDDVYMGDQYGNRNEGGTGEYEFLNIIIETDSTRYIMEDFIPFVNSSTDIVDYIVEHVSDDVIIIDLDEIVKKSCKDGEYTGYLRVESKKQRNEQRGYPKRKRNHD